MDQRREDTETERTRLIMKEEIINRLEELVKEEMMDETFAKADEIKNEYLSACEAATHEQHEKFLAEGGQSDDFQSPKDPLDSRFNELIHILSDRESKFKRLQKSEIHSRLKAKEDIINDLQKLITEETSIGKAFNSFKDLQRNGMKSETFRTVNTKTFKAFITVTRTTSITT